MFTRYKTDSKGRNVPYAKVYTQAEHPIHNSQIDKDALWVIRRIQANGEKAYIVGGAIRDLMLGKTPKDFDIATSASPRQIQRLFWNSRVIGRRFRIVHIFFNSKIIEVTTFRSDEENFEEGNNNIFGTMEQDSRRRDFSINSLYYNPIDGHLIDFHDSLKDFEKKQIRSLIPLRYSFSEDPVRMLRAIKYEATTGFSMRLDVKLAILIHHSAISLVSTSRLTDEMCKIFTSASSRVIIEKLRKYRVLQQVMPCLAVYASYDTFLKDLDYLDERVREYKSIKNKSITESEFLSIIARSIVVLDEEITSYDEMKREVFRQIKVFVSPLTPPNYEIERASELILSYLGKKSKKRTSSRKKQVNKVNKSAPKKVSKAKGSNTKITFNEDVKTAAEAHDL